MADGSTIHGQPTRLGDSRAVLPGQSVMATTAAVVVV